MSQDSREQFEAHYDDWSGMVTGTAKARRMKETYSDPKTSAAWVHWQASRAGVVVDLSTLLHQGYEGPLYYRADDVHAAIEAAGVKVAP